MTLPPKFAEFRYRPKGELPIIRLTANVFCFAKYRAGHDPPLLCELHKSPYIPIVGGFSMVKKACLFTVGGGLYVSLELLWRGRSHWTMFMLGGGCFLAIGELGKALNRVPRAARAAVGSGVCTIGELLTGLTFNRDYSIWDYRELPGNFRGQICLPFSLLWIPLSALAEEIYARLEGNRSA